MALFKRFRTSAAGDAAAAGRLGSEWIAVRRDAGDMAPAQCVTVVYGETGNSRRLVSFRSDGGAAKIACMKGERAWCFHPGSYVVDIVPFAAAPEIGLRMVFVIDAADPRVTQQRFDLFLVSEMDADTPQLTLESFGGQAQAAVRAALEQGVLDLPPCTSLDEWNLFRAGLNELMYTRFGVTVEDCVPVDLAPVADFAAMLRSRASAQALDALAVPAYKGAAAAGDAPPASHSVVSQPAAMQADGAALSPHSGSPAWPASTAAPSAPAAPRVVPAASPALEPAKAVPAAFGPGAPVPDAAPSSSPVSGPAVPEAAGALQDAAASHEPGNSAAWNAANLSSAAAAPPALDAAASRAPGERASSTPAGPAGPVAARTLAAPPAAPGTMAASHASAMPPAADGQLPSGWTAPPGSRAAKRDASAIRRLFLELPAISAALRQIVLPEGQKTFKQQQSILQRLSLLALDAGTMPSLDWSAPDQKAKQVHRSGRADQSRRAIVALDEAWSLLARLKQASPDEAANCLQEADRIIANLEYHLARRRNAEPQAEDRVEPKL